MILADQPELIALAQLAAVPASKVAAAFNDPKHFFEHLQLDEIGRLNDAVKRLGDLSRQLVEAAETYTQHVQASLEAAVAGAEASEDA